MNPKTEYPQYWLNQKNSLTKCASVYGAQGFESDYTGVIWGEDLVWRNGWEVNQREIMDNTGGNFSLKKIASKGNLQLARKLLFNRYKILLTRGIRGTGIYFEDLKTYEYISSLVE